MYRQQSSDATVPLLLAAFSPAAAVDDAVEVMPFPAPPKKNVAGADKAAVGRAQQHLVACNQQHQQLSDGEEELSDFDKERCV